MNLKGVKMIPHRSLGRENYDEGVNYRVVACRKRLRTVRSLQGSQISGEIDLQLEESENPSAKRVPKPTIKCPSLGWAGSDG
jgi:hypothetical protein